MNKNVASQKVTLLAIDTATNTPKTGDAANLTAYVSKDDGAVTVLGDTSATELDATNAPGLYAFDLTQGETNADKLVFSAKSSTSGIRVIPLLIYTRPPNFSTLTIANNAVDADLERIAGSVVSTSTAQLGVNAVQAGGTAWGSGAITAASIASAALTKAKFANDTGLIPSLTGTASAGAATTITLTGGVATNDYYNGSLVHIVSGTGAGQSRFITDYVGGTTVATVDTWITNPDNTSVFVVIPSFAIGGADIAAAVWNALIATYSGTSGSTAEQLAAAGAAGDPWATALPGAYGAGTAGKIVGDNINATISSRSSQATQDTIDSIVDQLQLDTDDIQTRLPAALVGGRIDANMGAVSADATAADNLETMLDGTGGQNLTATFVGNQTGNLSGSVGSVTGNVGGNVTGTIGGLAAQAKADVNAEVVDGLNVDTYTEPGQEAPGVNVSLVKKIGYLYKAWRNKVTQDSTTYKLFADDAATVDQKATLSDDATTFTSGEKASGP